MYNVLSGPAACGRSGVAAAAGVFFWHAASSKRRVARVARWRDASRPRQSSIISRRRQTCLSLSLFSTCSL